MRPGAGAYGVGGEDDEGVGDIRSKSFVKLIEIVVGWSLSEGRHWIKKTAWLIFLKICGEKELRNTGVFVL